MLSQRLRMASSSAGPRPLRRCPWPAVVLVGVLTGCAPTVASQNPAAMSATVTAAQVATAAATPAVTDVTASPSAGVANAGGSAVDIVEPPFQSPQTWAFRPAQLAVKVGTKLTWTNSGAVAHTVTADQAGVFDSGSVDPKASFTFTFSAPGTFAYHCTFHPWMKATVTVSP